MPRRNEGKLGLREDKSTSRTNEDYVLSEKKGPYVSPLYYEAYVEFPTY